MIKFYCFGEKRKIKFFNCLLTCSTLNFLLPDGGKLRECYTRDDGNISDGADATKNMSGRRKNKNLLHFLN